MSDPKIDDARQAHKAGRIDEATQIYRDLLQANEQSHEVWHLLGLAMLQRGLPQAAVEHCAKAISICGNLPAYHSNLGIAYQNLGQLEQACASFERALQFDRKHLPSLQNLGIIHLEQGHLSLAQRYFDQAQALAPRDPNMLLQQARACLQQKDARRALEHTAAALLLKPDWPAALLEQGNALCELGQLTKARDSFSKALALTSGDAQIACRLAAVCLDQKDFAAAENAARAAIAKGWTNAHAHNVLGVVLHTRGEIDAAIASLREAVGIQPDFVAAHVNLGVVLLDSGNSSAALACFASALLIDPTASDARCNRALALLKAGQYEEGWREYEWRWQRGKGRKRIIPRPRWDGSALNGRRILVHCEQGFGDTLQFMRYCRSIKDQGGYVIAAVPAPLVKLLSNCDSIDELVSIGMRVLPSFDVHIPLLSLPAIFRTNIDSVPCAMPYLQANDELTLYWRERLSPVTGLRIGIFWQGSTKYGGDRHRSIPLAEFESLAAMPGVSLVSLQLGFGEEQLEIARQKMPIHVLEGERDKSAGAFMDTAAIMANLDLVIGIDSALLHLAGVMGVPTWLAASMASDWRWLENREDSPWYPTIRLFRQSHLGEWTTVFQAMRQELQAIVAGDRTRLLPPPTPMPTPSTPSVPMSIGELLDKLSILEIKSERIHDPLKLPHVHKERELLRSLVNSHLIGDERWQQQYVKLKQLNEQLWEIEDLVRACEASQDFGDSFVKLARSVYYTNDRRAEVKRSLNELLESQLVEVKSYCPYANRPDAGKATAGT